MGGNSIVNKVISGDHHWSDGVLSKIFRPWNDAPFHKARAEAKAGLPRVLYISFSDTRGGAAIASRRLIKRLVKEDRVAPLELVSLQQADAPWTLSVGNAHNSFVWHHLRNAIAARNLAMSDPYGWLPFETAYIKRAVEIWQPDLVHMHNLHGGRGLLPLSLLPWLSKRAPIVWTLHDMWAATGHCAYSLYCEGWTVGCGTCPDLSLYPHILRDRTREIVEEHQQFFGESKPVLVSPSQWLHDVVKQAPATHGIDARVIPNGLDIQLFAPEYREAKRVELGIPEDATALMFAAESLSGDPRKGTRELRIALEHLSTEYSGDPIHIILMGNGGDDLLAGIAGLVIHRAGFVSEQKEAARLYAAADLFICPSLQDNLPNTLLEASACGTASIVFDAGGSKDAIEDGATGKVLLEIDPVALGEALVELASAPDRLRTMGTAARMRAENNYSDVRMAEDYLTLYRELTLSKDLV